MKKNLLALSAIVLAIVFSAFTNKSAFESKFQTDTYYLYDGSGAQTSTSNYTTQTTQPISATCPGLAQELCWFKVIDSDGNNIISAAEFNASFQALDGGAGAGNNTLDDESEVAGVLEKRSSF